MVNPDFTALVTDDMSGYDIMLMVTKHYVARDFFERSMAAFNTKSIRDFIFQSSAWMDRYDPENRRADALALAADLDCHRKVALIMDMNRIVKQYFNDDPEVFEDYLKDHVFDAAERAEANAAEAELNAQSKESL